MRKRNTHCWTNLGSRSCRLAFRRSSFSHDLKAGASRQLDPDDLVHGLFDEDHMVVAALEELRLMEAAA
jgi:hypothetical protein